MIFLTDNVFQYVICTSSMYVQALICLCNQNQEADSYICISVLDVHLQYSMTLATFVLVF